MKKKSFVFCLNFTFLFETVVRLLPGTVETEELRRHFAEGYESKRINVSCRDSFKAGEINNVRMRTTRQRKDKLGAVYTKYSAVIHKPTSCSSVLIVKLTVALLVKKQTTCYKNRNSFSYRFLITAGHHPEPD